MTVAMLLIALLALAVGLWLLLKVDGRRFAIAGIAGAVLVAFGSELGLAVCYVVGVS